MIQNISTGKYDLAHFDKLKFVPNNLRVPLITVNRKNSPIEEEGVSEGKKNKNDDEQYDFLQTMFGTTTSDTRVTVTEDEHDNTVEENRAEEGEQTRRSGRDRHPPTRLQITGGARYEEV